MLMLHYNVFAGIDVQGSARGSTEFTSTNWVMAMAQRPFLGGEITARVMLSAEPLLLGPEGYPLLLQTGETAGGVPLVDRQHPHDLFMELAVRYNRPLTGDLALLLYLAPAGEPALGPPGFPHRASAFDDPLAPLSHHWQDSTHITFGVVTAGLYSRALKVEGSWFNGREPDERRYGVDLRVPDSYSVRVGASFGDNLTAQASYGYLREPEVLEPGQDVQRLSASATYNLLLADGAWATTLAWGQNRSEGEASDAVVLESSFRWGRNTVFGRGEHVVKDRHDFALEEGDGEDDQLPVRALAAGYVRELVALGGAVSLSVGARVAVNDVGEDLSALYGSRVALGGMAFLRLRPAPLPH
jgi:hypothetical protein